VPEGTKFRSLARPADNGAEWKEYNREDAKRILRSGFEVVFSLEVQLWREGEK
jgi:hypothetical protein